MISGIRREVDENRALLGYYAAIRGNSLPMFRDNLSVSLTFRQPIDALIVCPTTSVSIYNYLLRTNPEERRPRPVILPHNIQRQSHQPDGSPASVT